MTIFGILLILIGTSIFLISINHLDRNYHDFNSPFLWILLFVGVMTISFGIVLIVMDR